MKTYNEFIFEAQVRFSKNLYKDKIPDDVLERLIDIDDTPTKLYANWIIKGYLKCDNKKVYLEDLYKIGQYLTLYDKMKKKNLIDKDIYKFSDYKELHMKMKEVGGLGDPNEDDEMYLIEDRYYINNGEAEIFFEDDNYLIVIPRTYKASRFYANNTEWCTRYPDQYERYSTEGDLYIIIDKKRIGTNIGDEYRLMQFHIGKNEYNFKDSEDNDVTREIRMKFVDIFKDLKGSFVLNYDRVYDDLFYGHNRLLVRNYIPSPYHRFGIINLNGKVILECEYKEIEYKYGFYYVTLDDNKGVFDTNGKNIVPVKYNQTIILNRYEFERGGYDHRSYYKKLDKFFHDDFVFICIKKN